LAKNNHINWTYKKRLKLESMLLLISRPSMCMDSLPIAGLAIHLQHQLLSCRTIDINPFNNKDIYSKLESLPKDFLNDLSNKTLSTSKLSNESQHISSDLMVS